MTRQEMLDRYQELYFSDKPEDRQERERLRGAYGAANGGRDIILDIPRSGLKAVKG